MIARLLAKSSRTPDAPQHFETLPGHLELVALAARRMTRDRGQQILAALGLGGGYEAALTEATVLAALLHDIGKANEDFQRMVRAPRPIAQALRHEIVGLWLLRQQAALAEWVFSDLAPDLRDVVLRAVVSHHLKFHSINSVQPRPAGRPRLRVLAGHYDFRAVLDVIRRECALGPAPDLSDLEVVLSGPLSELNEYLSEQGARWPEGDSELKAFHAAVSALLIAADVCGSALSRDGRAPDAWLSACLREVRSSSDLESVAAADFQGMGPRPFQLRVAHSDSRVTLVNAGCGTGKTAAAYLWASRNAHARKLFFCYPTTGTASEGFSNYWGAPSGAALVHSRAPYDIERICHNGSDEDALLEAQAGYRGLRPLAAKATICTVDTVLGLLQNHRTGLVASPAICGGAFVFDEIHLYDEDLFGTLLRFLQIVRGVPVLLMTASLQPSRREAISRCLAQVGERLVVIDGPPELEALPRYEIRDARAEETVREVEAALTARKRVLWVSNTVDRCVQVARQFEAAGALVEPYHSRYRYEDRVARHEAVTNRFGRGGEGQGVLAVTTQVCEVSLDISADLLVTDLAPAPSLVQRLGRLNRWARPGDGEEPRPALIVDVPQPAPYEQWELEESRRWIDSLRGRAVSQADLRKALEEVLAGQPIPSPRPSAWLDNGWTEIRPVTLRELTPSLTVVREEDKADCIGPDGRPDPVRIIANSIPMLLDFAPVRRAFEEWERLGGFVAVAPRGWIEYSPRWGGTWRR